ncbi:unnamed protein product [Ilex paraguariensis]|uniref:Uncharacterized protein n=1 Tax=Ilex paraguariensis TaxID=185542 RepID=A0ABC8THZ3_9AQUA
MEEGKAFCNGGEGWTCTITKTDASQAGKPFSKCGGSCTCVTDASVNQVLNLEQTLESSAGKEFCKCGEGWKCVISKTEGPEAGNNFFECGEGCVCVIDETNSVKIECL